MKLTKRQQEVLENLAGGKWLTALDLSTNRVTLNRLYRAGLVERRIREVPARMVGGLVMRMDGGAEFRRVK